MFSTLRGLPLPGPGFYWVKMEVEVPDGIMILVLIISDAKYFAQQIAVEPTYILSVSPTSVREDDDPTNIAVKVRVCDDL